LTSDDPLASAMRLVGGGAAIRTISTLLMVFSALVTTALAVRLLSPTGYGSLAFALAGVTLCAGLARLGLGLATTREVAANDSAGARASVLEVVRGASTLTLAWGVIGALAIATLVLMTQGALSTTERAVLGVGMGILLIGRNSSLMSFSVARGLGVVRWMEVPNIILSLGTLLTVTALFSLGIRRLDGIAIAYGVAGVVGIGVSILTVRRVVRLSWSPLRPSLAAAKRLLVTSGPYVLAGVATSAIAQFDVLVLGLTRPATEVATYEPVLRLTDRAVTLIPLTFLASFVPAATNLFVSREHLAFRTLYSTVSKYAFMLALPALLLLLAYPDSASRALYGGDFALDRRLIWLLLGGYIPHLALGLNLGALSATGNRRAISTAYAFSLVLMILSAVALIPWLGPIGAAAATGLTYLTLNVVASLWLYRTSGAHLLSRPLLLTWSSAVAPAVAALWLRSVLPDPSLTVAIALSLALWAGWVFLQFVLGTAKLHEIARLLPWVSRRRTQSVTNARK